MPSLPRVHQSIRHGAKVHSISRQRKRALHTGSRQWREIREEILARDGYTCAACKGFGDQVDHVNNNSYDNRAANLQTMCASCHSTKTATEQAGG